MGIDETGVDEMGEDEIGIVWVFCTTNKQQMDTNYKHFADNALFVTCKHMQSNLSACV